MMRCKFLVLLFSLTMVSLTHAEVVLDGTLGTGGSLPGPHFLIEAKLGQQVGSNLFHSFERFNLNSVESATFTGPDSINHVISRVTGGQVSTINGLLQSQIPNANMYFLNPAGIMFGPNAQINVPASLYVSTADYLKLGNTGRFDAITPENSLLTIASPSRFGFLDNTPANIIVEGSQLILKNDNKLARKFVGEDVPSDTLAFVGGDITIKEGLLITLGNDIHLVSVSSQGESPIEPMEFTDNTFAVYGHLNIIDTRPSRPVGNIDASGFGGGEVFIRAGQFLLDNGWVFADTLRQGTGQGITIYTSEALTLQNTSLITTETYSDNPANIATITTGGDAGSITIKAGDINLMSGSQINSNSRTFGAAGDITLLAQETLFISGMDNSGQLRSGVLSNTLSRGTGGQVTLSANTLKMDNDAQVRAGTTGIGNAGNLLIQVKDLEVLGGSQINMNVGDQRHIIGSGKGGTLAIEAQNSVLVRGVSANIFNALGQAQPSGLFSNAITNQGQGGTIKLAAPVATIDKGGNIQAITAQHGNAGHIALNVDTLKLSEGSIIGTQTLTGRGNGGNIEIIANEAVLIQGTNTGISAAASPGTSGRGGHVKIAAGQLQLTEGGAISGRSEGQGHAGNITLALQDKLQMQAGSIRTSATSADGGNIDITAPSYLYLMNSEITTSVGDGEGAGGNLMLKPEFIVLDGSKIIAQAYGGPGGNINITTTGIYNFTDEPIVEVINASSKYGVDGIITIDSPDEDISEDLLVLSSAFIDVSTLLRSPCQITFVKKPSQFLVTPYGGSPPSPYDWKANLLLPFQSAKKEGK